MRKNIALFIVFTMFFHIQSVFAQDKAGAINSGILFGINSLTAPEGVKDNYEIGFNFQGQIGYIFNSNVAAFPVVLQYCTFSPEKDLKGVDNFSVFSLTPSVMLSIDNEQSVNPYLILGLGIYNHRNGNSTTDFGFNVGGGVEFMISDVSSVSVQAKYHSISAENENINYFDFNFGFNYYIGMW